MTTEARAAALQASRSTRHDAPHSSEAQMRTMANLIEQWKKRTRRKSIGMIVFALVQLTSAAALVWRMALKDAVLKDNAAVVAAVFLCVSISYPLIALFRVIFVPVVLDPDAVVPAALLRELLRSDLVEASVRARSRLREAATLTFRELLELCD